MVSSVDICMPSEQQEGTKSVLGRWLKAVGQPVAEHEPLVEITTDKVTLEVASPARGVLSETLKHPNDSVAAGELLGRIRTDLTGDTAEHTTSHTSHLAFTSGPSTKAEPVIERGISPAVRQIAREYGVDLSTIQGSGLGGRVTYDDVTAVLAARTAASKQHTRQSGAPTTIESRKVPHTPMRTMIADRMVESLIHTAPHVTSVFQADLTAISQHRERHRAEFERQGVRLTLTAYFVRAVVDALLVVPEVNSRWHSDHLEIFGECNIGIATATGDVAGRDAGLMVPVIRRAEQLDLLSTARELQTITEKARRGALQPIDMQGGTFTISNHGMSGSLLATPIIINQPQSAILGIGKVEKRVVVKTVDGIDTLQILPMAYVTLTLDHRVLDGFKANRFLTAFVESIEHRVA